MEKLHFNHIVFLEHCTFLCLLPHRFGFDIAVIAPYIIGLLNILHLPIKY